MIVYIDLAMLISFIQNLCLLLVTGMCMKENLNLPRIIMGGLTGTAYQLVCIIYPVNSVFFSVAVAFIQIFIAYGRNTVKLTFTFIMVAVITAGESMNRLLSFVLSLSIIPCTVIYIRKSVYISSLNRNVVIKVHGKELKISGFVDSGNEIKTIIIGRSHAIKVLGKEKTKALLSFEEGGVIPCTTIKGESLLSVFNAESVTVDGQYSSMKIGVMNENLPYAILPVEFLEGTDINVEKTGAEAKETTV